MPSEPLTVRRDVPLAPLTTLRVGGPASWYWPVQSQADVVDAVSHARHEGVPLVVMGGGSNLVVSDAGFEGVVLHMGMSSVAFAESGDEVTVTAGAGAEWDAVVAASVERGLAGLECLSGIPGTVGGTPVQNVGAYGQDVSTSIERVNVIDLRTGTSDTFGAADCAFGYRTSRFKGPDAGRYAVTAVTFRLGRLAAAVAYPDVIAYMRQHAIISPDVRAVREAVLAIRRRKGMVLDPTDTDTRSVGSFFMNPVIGHDHYARLSAQEPAAPSFPIADGVKIPAAWLIQQAGFGPHIREGGASISSKHPLAIVNRDGASARDVVRLAVRIKREVGERFGIALLPEARFIGFNGDPEVAFLLGTDN